LIETSNAYARGLLRGIESYVRENRAWSIYLVEHGRGDRPPSWLSEWEGDGIIARIENKTIARALEPLRVAIVDVSAACLIPRIPYVETDDAAIAELAAAHFAERGFKTLAYCGDQRFRLVERPGGKLRANHPRSWPAVLCAHAEEVPRGPRRMRSSTTSASG